MVDLIIAGTVALDDIETPYGKKENVLGGSATYASLAATFFAKPGIVAIVGEDFPKEHEEFLKSKNICIKGIEKKGKTFRWGGKYAGDMNEAKTLKTELNCLSEFNPILPEEYKKAKFLFLGNLDPKIQLSIFEQLESPELIVMDTMNYWITNTKERLLEAISKIDVLVLNDGEARQLFNTSNLHTAAKKALALGPKAAIIKKGEHGALLYTKDKNSFSHFSAPGYPLEQLKDPTGCGDSFGGSIIGYMASQWNRCNARLDEKTLRKAVIYASSVASHNAEGFGTERMGALTKGEVEARFEELKKMRDF